jgi:flagellar capping protein FliD
MASIQSLGIGSGLLTSDLLDKLIEAERAPQVRRLDAQQEFIEARLSAFGEVSSRLSDFNAAIKSVNSLAAFNASKTDSSNEAALTATAGSTAAAGSYSVQIQALAQQHTLASQAYGSVNEAIGTGSLSFRFGTTTFDDGDYDSFAVNPETVVRNVQISAANNSLAGIRDAVNAAGIGVQATIVDDGSGFRLLFTSAAGGAKNSLEITASGTAGLNDFNFNASSQALVQTQAAQDAQFTVNGLSISRDSNLVVGVIPGVTLNLRSTTTGPVSLGVSKDPADLLNKVQSVVDSYNALKDLSDTLTRFNPDVGARGQASLLTGDTALRRMMSEISNTLRAFGGTDTYRSLAEIGVRTDQFDNYRLKFDRAVFSDAFNSNAAAVTALFAVTGTVSDNQISYLGNTNATLPGTYNVEVTRMATTGNYTGVSVPALTNGDIQIDASNRSFTILLNGLEADIQLATGTYATAADFAEQLQQQINSNPEVLAAEHSVTVLYNADSARFELTSNRFGNESVIRFTDISSATSAILGLVPDGSGPYRTNRLSSLASTDGQSSSAFNTPLLINNSPQFSLQINGVSTGVLSLPGSSGSPVTYNTPDELTAALKTVIDAALADDGLEIFVDYVFDEENDYGQLVFATAAAGDQISFSNINFAAANQLGLFVGTGTAAHSVRGQDVAGRINGIEAQGSGQILTASSGTIAARPGFFLHGPFGDLSAATANDRFRINVDGVLSGEITIGVLPSNDPETIAGGLQTAINNNPALLAAGVSVKVEFDFNSGGFGIISNSFGAASSVTIASLSGNAGSILGFTTGRGNFGAAGRDASGEPDAATGIRLLIEGGSTGSRGTVTFERGVAARLGSLIDAFLAPGGVLTGRQDALGQELKDLADKRVALDERIARSERRLSASFTANDIIISRFNTTADFLTSQLTMLEQLAAPQQRKRR